MQEGQNLKDQRCKTSMQQQLNDDRKIEVARDNKVPSSQKNIVQEASKFEYNITVFEY